MCPRRRRRRPRRGHDESLGEISSAQIRWRSATREVAGDEVLVAAVDQVRTLDPGDRPRPLGVVAAGVERTALGHLDQAGRGSPDRQQPDGRRLVEARHRAQKPPRVGVFRRVEDLVGTAVLGRPAGVHHHDVVGQLGDHPEVVGDDHDGGVELLLQVADQVEDLRLDGDVESRGRLVGDQQGGVAGQRHRDHRSLAHPAGELVRVGVDPLVGLGDADAVEHLDRMRAGQPSSRRRCGSGRPPRSGCRRCRRGASRTAGPGRSSPSACPAGCGWSPCQRRRAPARRA